MTISSRKSAILAKIESVYGTDPVPTGGANAMLVENINVVPLQQDTIERGGIQTFFGGRQRIETGSQVNLSFDVELAGAGAAGTAAPYAVLLKAAAFAETLSGGVSAIYNPISDSIESATIYFFADGLRHKVTGCRGNVEIKLSARQMAMLSFNFVGAYVAVDDTAAVPDSAVESILQVKQIEEEFVFLIRVRVDPDQKYVEGEVVVVAAAGCAAAAAAVPEPALGPFHFDLH